MECPNCIDHTLLSLDLYGLVQLELSVLFLELRNHGVKVDDLLRDLLLEALVLNVIRDDPASTLLLRLDVVLKVLTACHRNVDVGEHAVL